MKYFLGMTRLQEPKFCWLRQLEVQMTFHQLEHFAKPMWIIPDHLKDELILCNGDQIVMPQMGHLFA